MEFRQRDLINTHKVFTPFVILGLMYYFENFSIGPMIYFGLHTGYCVCWLLKEFYYPDKSFDGKISPVEFVFAFIFLGLYWVAPIILISSGTIPHPITIVLSVPVCLIGFFFHFGADAQKYFVLKERKGLITDGFFSSTRNPNYFGEFVTYLGWGALAESIIPLVVLMSMVFFIFYPYMARKEKSMSRYPEFENYKKNSNFFFPKLF